MRFTRKDMGYYYERAVICGLISLVIGRMSHLDGSYSTYLSCSIYAVLMAYSIITKPVTTNDPEVKALLALSSAQSATSCTAVSDGGSD